MKTKFTSVINVLFAIFLINIANAQTNKFPTTGAASIGTISPSSSALLEIKSTAKGFLMSRMMKAQRDSISSLVTRLIIYQPNNTPDFHYYDGSVWNPINTKGANTSLSNLKTPTAINVNVLPDSNSTSNPESNGTIQTKELRVNDIPINARRNFMKSFKNIQNAEWHKIEDGYSVYFNQGGIPTEIRYKQDGEWLCNIRTCYEDQLSPSIKNLIKAKYKDYAVVVVREYECYVGTMWMVSLDSKREQILVRVQEDEMREIHHFYKSE